ncbi:hypothetical protein CEUSTIGMA_g3316.t1 [Chlamydomonas eustigma]|uniref:Methyltransferase domain-containing protein n=1 Tax=Chlamydomonas eustigma TaxID=1157962 RepID=A0A250WYF8_9CHLO|nr:hypothetical protein CEUSTIGMA_g3316.t1 [Chlamydomonas eustigma]|eukprot:GAX75873.1 hypothetical protein CEUSTIGMA_g3316.t1 [Chlamydomonas eustigma]
MKSILRGNTRADIYNANVRSGVCANTSRQVVNRCSREDQQIGEINAHKENSSSISSRTVTTLYEVADEGVSSSPSSVHPAAWGLGAVATLGASVYGLTKSFESGSRPYTGNVGQEYDAWTEEGILEHYWGEHIHLGYYSDKERSAGYVWKDFKKAKYDFIDEMLKFSTCSQPTSILDVGCGFGGTSRHLANMFPKASVRGITLSPKQVQRGTELAKERGLNNVEFKVMDALKMEYEDNSFDLVWACESGEHMPDKKKYVDEMVRVLKPGGVLVIACWCQREETPEKPLTEQEKKELKFLYDEWAHPYFISIEEFERLTKGTGVMEAVATADWTPETIPSWHHSIVDGATHPWLVMSKPHIWYKTARDVWCILRMHDAFDKGLMQYGMITGRKVVATSPA